MSETEKSAAQTGVSDSGTSDKATDPKGSKEAKKTREERLAEALRANLRRRKVAAKKA